jgi:hypothetical protein
LGLKHSVFGTGGPKFEKFGVNDGKKVSIFGQRRGFKKSEVFIL